MSTRHPLRIAGSPGRLTTHALLLILPIPAPILSPNGRSHWARKARSAKSHRRLALLQTLELLGGNPPPCPVAYSYAYYWPGPHRDDDNAIASAKAYLDGACEALRVDDAHLRFRSLHHHADRRRPRLEMTIHLYHPGTAADLITTPLQPE